MSASSFAVEISKVRAGIPESLADSVAVEEPLEIRLGYSTPDGRATRSISITMRTPGNDEELAAGFLYTEAIISKASDIASIETCGPPAPDSGNHNVIRVDLAADVEVDLGRLQRHFYTTSSCGVCGKTSLDALRVGGATAMSGAGQTFRRAVLTTIPDALREAQHTFD
ncbi:MAG: formate dehydrogenase accessory sulfurtransferase FdhD, partial [Woeseiaceae bacterium]